MNAELLNILQSEPHFLHISDIRRRLAARQRLALEHELIAALRDLLRQGSVEYRGGRWRAAGASRKAKETNFSGFPAPRLSLETIQLVGQQAVTHAHPAAGPELTPPAEDQTSANISPGPWRAFREFLGYYRDCIRNEGGAEAMASLGDQYVKFVFFSQAGSWLPRPGKPWRHAVPLGSHLGPLVQRLSGAGQDAFLVLGYPIQAIHFQREGEPDTFLLKPVFHYPLEHSLNEAALTISIEEACVQINLDWLHHTFKKPEQRHAFLAACGFVGGDGHGASGKRFGLGPESYTATVSAFLDKALREPLLPDSIPSVPTSTTPYDWYL